MIRTNEQEMLCNEAPLAGHKKTDRYPGAAQCFVPGSRFTKRLAGLNVDQACPDDRWGILQSDAAGQLCQARWRAVPKVCSIKSIIVALGSSVRPPHRNDQPLIADSLNQSKATESSRVMPCTQTSSSSFPLSAVAFFAEERQPEAGVHSGLTGKKS